MQNITYKIVAIFFGLVLAGFILMNNWDTDDSRYRDSWEARISAEGLTDEEFTTLYLEAIQRLSPGVQARIEGPLEVVVKFPEKESEFHCYLDNAWRACAYEPQARVKVCDYYIDKLYKSVTSDKALELYPDINMIVPVMKGEDYIDNLPQQPDGNKPIVAEHFAADIWILYGLKFDDWISFLTEDELRILQLQVSELRPIAVGNLKRMIPELKIYGKGPIRVIEADGDLEAGLLLVDKLWEDLEGEVNANIVAAIPCKGYLLFTGSESPEEIEKTRNFVNETYEEAYGISKTLLIRIDRKWKPFDGNLTK